MLSQIGIPVADMPTAALADWLVILDRTPGADPAQRAAAEAALRGRIVYEGTRLDLVDRKTAPWWMMVSADDMAIKARFGTTVCALVKAGLGIAIIDQFTVAHGAMPGIAAIPIEEPTQFQTYVAIKKDKAPSLYAESFVKLLREEMNAVVMPQGHDAASSPPKR